MKGTKVSCSPNYSFWGTKTMGSVWDQREEGLAFSLWSTWLWTYIIWVVFMSIVNNIDEGTAEYIP